MLYLDEPTKEEGVVHGKGCVDVLWLREFHVGIPTFSLSINSKHMVGRLPLWVTCKLVAKNGDPVYGSA